MDVFQIRLDFLALLKRLNASQQAMQKVLAFADRNVKASSDIWDCIISECAKTNLSSRLNILFTLDYLFTDYSSQFSRTLVEAFLTLAARDLPVLIDQVVPNRDATAVKLNSAVTMSTLNAWRVKRLFAAEQLNDLMTLIQHRRQQAAQEDLTRANDTSQSSQTTHLSKDEIVRRIEEDRERHKRIREKLWVLPPRSFLHAVPDVGASTSSSKRPLGLPPLKKQRLDNNTLTPPSPDDATSSSPSASALASPALAHRPDPLDIHFEDLWETTSDLNEDDLEAWNEEAEQRWWGGSKVWDAQQKMMAQRRVLEQSRQQKTLARHQEARVPPPAAPPPPPPVAPLQDTQPPSQPLPPPPPPPPRPPIIPTGPSSSTPQQPNPNPGWRERNGYLPAPSYAPPRRSRPGRRW